MSYSAEYFVARERWRDWRIEARELIRLARVTQGARMLEIGCGGGGLLRMLAARGARGVGVDTLDVALDLAQRKWDTATRGHGDIAPRPPVTTSPRPSVPASFIRIAEDNRLPCADNAFDAILAQHAVEHIADVDAALREWARVLRHGGRLALATPNARYPDPTHFADADHARIFDPRELRYAVERAGFTVEECATIFPYLGRARAARGLGVVAYRAFRRLPYFRERGRTILIGACLDPYVFYEASRSEADGRSSSGLTPVPEAGNVRRTSAKRVRRTFQKDTITAIVQQST